MKLETALKLEKVVEKLITSRLQSLNPPENFDRAKVDIYPGDYGIHCHITFLMKKPFSREDSDFFYGLNLQWFKYIHQLLVKYHLVTFHL